MRPAAVRLNGTMVRNADATTLYSTDASVLRTVKFMTGTKAHLVIAAADNESGMHLRELT